MLPNTGGYCTIGLKLGAAGYHWVCQNAVCWMDFVLNG